MWQAFQRPRQYKISGSSAVKNCSIRRSQFQNLFQAQNHLKTISTLRPRDSFCFLLVSSHFFYPNFKRSIPSQKVKSGFKQQVRIPLNIPKHSTKITCHEPLPSPRQSHSRNDSENPSGATAVFVGRIHRGPRRDQLLDHGAVAAPSRPMQRRLASGAEDARRKEQQLRLPSRNKAYSHGMFLRVVGQKNVDRSYR